MYTGHLQVANATVCRKHQLKIMRFPNTLHPVSLFKLATVNVPEKCNNSYTEMKIVHMQNCITFITAKVNEDVTLHCTLDIL